MKPESYIEHGKGSTTLVGPDAMEFFRAATLKGALGLYAKTGMKPTRGVNLTDMLALAKRYTGKTYPKTRDGAAAAAADVDVWVQNMRAALPDVEREEPKP